MTTSNARASKTKNQIAALGRMNLATLRKAYRETFGKTTTSSSRDHLRRRLVAHLEQAAAEPARPRDRDERLPPPGTVLSREHGGHVHKVTVLEDGFRYERATYGSLSTVAKEITGTVWNGYSFFARALQEVQT